MAGGWYDSGRIRNVFDLFGSGIIIPDPRSETGYYPFDMKPVPILLIFILIKWSRIISMVGEIEMLLYTNALKILQNSTN